MSDELPDPTPRTRAQPNWTTLALIGGLVILLLIIAYFATNRNPDQDKLINGVGGAQTEQSSANPGKACAAQSTYDAIKRELFRRAAQLRGSDQAAYDRIAASASLRMENPVLENEDGSTGALNCSGSLSLDLPPGLAVAGGRRTLSSNVDYSIQPAADDSGSVVLLRNADAIVTPLATLGRVSQPAPPPVEGDEVTDEPIEPDVSQSESADVQPGPETSYPGRPSFDCDDASTRSEIAVCSDSGLSALDLNMAKQYRRAVEAASGQERALLQQTRDRFLAYRDRCSSRQCIADAYTGRMREIRDIMEGNWHPPR